GRFVYGGDRYGLETDRGLVNRHINPGVGFVRRGNVAMNFASGRFSPRLPPGRAVRQLTRQTARGFNTNTAASAVEDRAVTGIFGMEFNSSDDVKINAVRQYERLPGDFTIARGVVVPAGGYTYQSLEVAYTLAQQRMVSGNAAASYGSFYGGTRTSA